MTHKILIVDDHKFAVSIMEFHLVQNGYRVLKAYDGYLALKLVRQEKSNINLIITDLHMPEMNGIEFAHTSKRLKISTAPIMLVTSDLDVKDQFIQDAKFQVFDDLLFKPISAPILLTKVSSLVQLTEVSNIKSSAKYK